MLVLIVLRVACGNGYTGILLNVIDSLPPDSLPAVGTTLLPRRPFEFTFWLAPDVRNLSDWSSAPFEAGADDCSPGVHCGEPYVAFHREAESLEEAVRSAHRHVQAASCRVLRCEITAEEMAGAVPDQRFHGL